MQIQSITQQPNFNGKVILKKGTTDCINSKTAAQMDRQLKQIASLIQDKQYDIFILKNKQNPDFYNVAANTSMNKVRKIKEYTVKVQKEAMASSIVDAVKEAMEMYEKYIAKGYKG